MARIFIVTSIALLSGGAYVWYVPISDPALTYIKPASSPSVLSVSEVASTTAEISVATPPTLPSVQHVPLPEAVKAIYMSACVAGTPSFREELIQLVEETELNAIMIDIKDFSGTLSFAPTDPWWLPAWQASRCGAQDMREFIADLHERGIFVIGRVTVFQDPFLAERVPEWAVKRRDGTVWHDHKGLSFIDVAAHLYWEKIVDLSVDAYTIGFDEINFDYVRYPSDGNMVDIDFPLTRQGEWPEDKPANLEAFFAYISEELRQGERFNSVNHIGTGRVTATPWISADVFGMTTTNTDDLSIGQIQERILPYVDFLAPMVYPSHYPKNFMGYPNPNLVPYEIVYHAMRSGVVRAQATTTSVDAFTHTRLGTSTPALYAKSSYGGERFRTWIQDFDYGGDYDAADVRAQIQASYDAGVPSWMIWAPSNRYTREALITATSSDSL